MKRAILSVCLVVAASRTFAPVALAEGHDRGRNVKGDGHHDRGWVAGCTSPDSEPSITYPPTSSVNGVYFGYPPEPVPGYPRGNRYALSGKCQPVGSSPSRAVWEPPQ
ncbi:MULTISPECIES: hypothetical protein [Agrobacterium]|jgi:hypothetical protein|uniref:hypothetical protein n=1 Tax=Agrobacterium TaxID=357 RepID=UPI0013AEE951|nr:hypothetical protein [Agrobacterium sp. SORGH_AS_0745]MDP9759121.1 hypothetical protein [Agrobacterium tumefaciens]MDQ1223551.1 hypothetical protein [Agrobacterium sp. SORGH_AS_0745]